MAFVSVVVGLVFHDRSDHSKIIIRLPTSIAYVIFVVISSLASRHQTLARIATTKWVQSNDTRLKRGVAKVCCHGLSHLVEKLSGYGCRRVNQAESAEFTPKIWRNWCGQCCQILINLLGRDHTYNQ